MDDKSQIVRNDALFDAGFLQIDFFSSDSSREQGSQYVVFRPITQALNALPAFFFGKNAFVYRVMNLLLFFLACVSIYELLNVLFKNSLLALLAAVLFCIHPINGVLVNYITATGYSVFVISINFALLCYLKAQREVKKRYYAVCIIFFLIALLCHETAIAFPLYLGAVLICVFHQERKKVFYSCLPFVMILIVYILFRQYYAPYTISFSERLNFIGISFSGFLAAFSNCVLWYVKALFFLSDIVLMRASPEITEHVLLWNAGLLGGFGVLTYLLFYQFKGENAFGLSWFMIGLTPVFLACLSRPSLGVIIEPHWLFFSTIGFCVLIASIIIKISQHVRKELGAIVFTIIFFGYGLTTASYNELWAEEKKYCHYMLRLSPQMHITASWLADAYRTEGNFSKAKVYYLKTIKGYRSDWEAYTNLGLMEDELGNTERAERLYLKAISIDPGAAQPKNNLAAMYIEQGKFQEAKQLLFDILKSNRYFTDAQKNLIVLYTRQGLETEARQVMDILVKDDLSDADISALLKNY